MTAMGIGMSGSCLTSAPDEDGATHRAHARQADIVAAGVALCVRDDLAACELDGDADGVTVYAGRTQFVSELP